MVGTSAPWIDPKLLFVKPRWNNAESPLHILEITVHIHSKEAEIENGVRSFNHDVPLISRKGRMESETKLLNPLWRGLLAPVILRQLPLFFLLLLGTGLVSLLYELAGLAPRHNLRLGLLHIIIKVAYG